MWLASGEATAALKPCAVSNSTSGGAIPHLLIQEITVEAHGTNEQLSGLLQLF
jgi:hypothetical protein